MWHDRWDRGERRHLHQIQRIVRVMRESSGCRREETVLTRLRLGRCALNKWLKIAGQHQTGFCEGCPEDDSVEHAVRCRKQETQRPVMRSNPRELGVKYFTLKRVLSMSERAQIRAGLAFLRSTGFSLDLTKYFFALFIVKGFRLKANCVIQTPEQKVAVMQH